jgi:16S rRNA pseudouridine516 synthase
MRLDKYLANLWHWSRNKVKYVIKDWLVLVNWELITKKEFVINFWDIISIWEEKIEYKEFIYILLNKPDWYVSNKKDEAWHPSYIPLISDCPYSWILNIVWRLDYDTTWLLLLTNDWQITHKIIHPKKNIFKKYLVKAINPFTNEDIENLTNWVEIDEYITKPAKVEKISDTEIYLSIREWKFHQIKKMMNTIWNEVSSLHRVSIWKLELWDLQDWKWRFLSNEEIEMIKKL